MKIRTYTCLATLLVCSISAMAGPTFDTQEKAKEYADYAFQGEYAGEVAVNGQSYKVGLQVVALGKGKFKASLYPHGLPGDGWDQKTPRVELPGESDGDSVTFKLEGRADHVRINKDGKIKIHDNELGSVEHKIEKVQRKSPTLGRKAPEGAVVLFDGTKESLKNWNAGARITEDGLLMQGVTSKKKFGSHRLHVEFRLPFQPEDSGQNRGNSGLYLQGRYEVQMLDSFGLSGEHNEAGGIYSIKKPDLNMCFPPLTWQTYDVYFTEATYDENGKKTVNAKITVFHNGVKIHDKVELPRITTAAPVAESPEDGPVYLQDHSNPMRYRNIWVIETKDE